MKLSSVYDEIKQFLSISDANFNLKQNIDNYFSSDKNKVEIISDILNFINRFSMFKDIKPFMNSLYRCINNTLEIRPDSIFDFEELLIKNSIMHFIQEYVNYTKLTQKDQVFNFLTDSLERLETQPLIINLGLLLKPMYQDQAYLDSLNKTQEVEVKYDSFNEIDIQIKNHIDNWLKKQDISLNNQEVLKKGLFYEFNKFVSNYNISLESEKIKILKMEIMEMLSMKLTMLSLIEHFPADSFEPISIK